jgi:hypothetical protein
MFMFRIIISPHFSKIISIYHKRGIGWNNEYTYALKMSYIQQFMRLKTLWKNVESPKLYFLKY